MGPEHENRPNAETEKIEGMEDARAACVVVICYKIIMLVLASLNTSMGIIYRTIGDMKTILQIIGVIKL